VKRRARTASTALASTRAAFPARSAFHRHVLRLHSQAAPATDLAALPLRSGFRRSFASPMLSHVKARSPTVTRAIHPGSRGPRAACRLLQSITIDEHNCLIDRTPLTARGVAPRRSFNRSPSVGLRRLLSSCGTGWPNSCSKLSQPRCHGSGARHEDHPMPASFTTIARDGKRFPQPDRLGHLVSRARFNADMEVSTPTKILNENPHVPAGQEACFRETSAAQGRLSHPLAKGNTIRRTQGAFHR
jgi:hypothetical protein